MTILSWVKHWFGSGKKTRAAKRRRVILRVEALEARVMPALVAPAILPSWDASQASVSGPVAGSTPIVSASPTAMVSNSIASPVSTSAYSYANSAALAGIASAITTDSVPSTDLRVAMSSPATTSPGRDTAAADLFGPALPAPARTPGPTAPASLTTPRLPVAGTDPGATPAATTPPAVPISDPTLSIITAGDGRTSGQNTSAVPAADSSTNRSGPDSAPADPTAPPTDRGSQDPNADPTQDPAPPADDSAPADPAPTPADFAQPDAPADVPADLADTPDAGSANQGLLSPSTPAPASLPATIYTGGSYERHYDSTGSNAYSRYSLDVLIESTLGTDINGTPSESGTVTYTLTQTNNGVRVPDVTDTDDFNTLTVSGTSTVFQGLTTTGALSGYDTARFGLGSVIWDHQTWNDTVTFDARGFTPTGLGGPGYFTSHYTSDASWYSDRTLTAASSDGSTTEVDNSGYHNGYTSDVTVSDLRANTNPDPAALGDDGYPTDQFAVPIAGTTFLSRSFATYSSGGTDERTSTDNLASNSDEYLLAVHTDQHNDYSGQTSARTYVNSTTVGGGVGSSDRLTLNVDARQTTTFSGANHSDVDLDLNAEIRSGTYWATALSDTNTAADNFSLSDLYYRNGNSGLFVGLAKSGRTASGGSHRDETVDQTYDGTGKLTNDTLDYTYTAKGNQKTTSSDIGIALTPVANASGVPIGQTTKGYNLSAELTTTLDSSLSGTANRIDSTGTVDNTVGSTTDGSTKARVVTHYAATDGSDVYDARSLVRTTQGSTSDSTILGGFNADGKQDDGTATSSVFVRGGSNADTWSRRAQANQPATTVMTVGSGTTRSGVRTNLTYNSDGTADGTIRQDGRSGSTVDRKVWVRGSKRFAGGVIYVNDFDHSNTKTTGVQGADLTVSADVVSGTTNSRTDVTIGTDSSIYQAVDLDGDKLHSRTEGSADGTVTTGDRITTTITAGIIAGTRGVNYTRVSSGESLVYAYGNVSDAYGHTGNWSYDAGAKSSANDKVDFYSTLTDGDWKETGRRFDIDEKKSGNSEFHLEDDGVGKTPGEGQNAVWTHVNDIKTSFRDYETRVGTPSAYNYSWDRQSEYKQTETGTGSWSSQEQTNPISGNFSTRNVTERRRENTQRGSATDGVKTPGYITIRSRDYTLSRREGRTDAPTYTLSYKNGSIYKSFASSLGNRARGSTYRLVTSGTLNWSQRIDKTAAWEWWGTTTTGSPGFVNSTLVHESRTWDDRDPLDAFWDWGRDLFTALGDDLASDPDMRWVANNAGDLLRIVGGAVDVAAGVVTMLSTFGLGALPGVGLIALGIDQIMTGQANIITGVRSQSAFEFGGYSAAVGVGFNEDAAQTIGGLTPAALSVGFGVWGALSPRNQINLGRARRVVPDEINFGRGGRTVPNEINFGQAGRTVPNEINFGRQGNSGLWQYGETGDAFGLTDKFGNITIRPGLTGRELSETVGHEAVHRFFSARSGPLMNLRANVGMWGYNNSHLLKYLEEAMAETVGTGSLWKGLTFPLQADYGLSGARIAAEAGGYTIFVGGAAYGAYRWSND